MKIVAIVNPVAGFRRAPQTWPELVNQAGAQVPQIVTWWTKGPGHAELLAAQAKRLGFERILAVGGDGTIFEVINGLWWEPEGRLPSLGIVPFGTGCDYVRNFEIGSHRFANLLNALGETTFTVDAAVFQVRDRRGKSISRVSLNVLGAGFDAQVVAHYQRQKIPLRGKLPYFLSGFQELCKLKHFRWVGEIDGNTLEDRSLIFVGGFGRYFGGGMMVTPSASPQSGRLQLVWDQQLTRLSLILLLSKIYNGRHLPHPQIFTRFASKLNLVTEPPVPVESDGELIGWTPLDVEVCLHAFQVAAAKIRF
jgi:diacylglycerol kinase (ATP)